MSDKQKLILSILAVVVFIGVFALAYFAFGQKPSQIVINYPDGKESLEFGPLPSLSYPDFFNEVKEKFIAEKESFIEADLSAMTLRLYKDGTVVKEVPIKTKGKEGSWWETPAGLYKIETKEESHFSSFGHVYQPYSMSFQGNFFIHGWPYHPDGTPVSSTFSGGCIRLADEDAKAIYSEASVGMPVLVYEKDFAGDGFTYEVSSPQVSAKSYIVADLNNSAILLERDSSEVLPIASLTKLLTALTAAEYINMDKPIVISSEMLATTSIRRLKEGESIKAFHLLYPLLMESSNEAAEALALSKGENLFVALMNKKAEALGMKNTKFTDPTGSDDTDVSTARDLFALARYIYHNRSFVFDISTGDVNEAVYGVSPFPNLRNFNIGSDDTSFVGGKVGKTTAAHDTALSVFEVTHKGQKRPIAFIVLGSDDSGKDIETLLSYIKNTYK